VPKSEFASRNWYDIWFPTLAPSVETMKLARQAETPAQWRAFAKRYKAEMASPEAAHAIALLAALSHRTDFSVGCYCQDEARCHRSILRELLVKMGAKVGYPKTFGSATRVGLETTARRRKGRMHNA
jgi:uncharacterized protein YeaO (DUF488 family)